MSSTPAHSPAPCTASHAPRSPHCSRPPTARAPAEDLERLRRLPARETHLALVKERYSNVRANVWFVGLDARNRGRVMVAAELPLLYPLGRSKELPEIRYPDAEQGARTTPIARTGKLEDKPFLDSLPVYRYRPAPRRGEPRRR